MENEVLKLVDFGSAQPLSKDPPEDDEKCVFDIEFSAPELILSSNAVSTSADLWSTGVILYVCLR